MTGQLTAIAGMAKKTVDRKPSSSRCFDFLWGMRWSRRHGFNFGPTKLIARMARFVCSVDHKTRVIFTREVMQRAKSSWVWVLMASWWLILQKWVWNCKTSCKAGASRPWGKSQVGDCGKTRQVGHCDAHHLRPWGELWGAPCDCLDAGIYSQWDSL